MSDQEIQDWLEEHEAPRLIGSTVCYVRSGDVRELFVAQQKIIDEMVELLNIAACAEDGEAFNENCAWCLDVKEACDKLQEREREAVRSQIINVLLATRSMSDGVTADAILAAMRSGK